ncbi:MAG: group II intron reverse transcriptase domain-containing protein [Magnetococcales bacterium]|nr:group II intron reverse transcriptase domain-containing protein [Magnetococcales bacterium]
MKRVGNLFDFIVDFGNLLSAAKRARQGCGWGVETSRFFFHLEPELLELREQLTQGTYQPGAYRFFEVRDPKRRTIAVAPFRDRVVHHAVVAVLEPVYERMFIHDSYATRKGKGTHAAIERAQRFLRRWPCYLKMDVEKFFDSVNHDTLLNLLARKLDDPALLSLLERIIRNSSLPGIGLPIGNLTSQFLANVYLDPFDHLIKDRWGVPGYVRYMDDWVIFGDEPENLRPLIPAIEQFLADHLGLRPKPDGTRLNRAQHGLGFLGVRIFPGYIRQIRASRQRGLRRLKERHDEWRCGLLSDDRLSHSLDSLVGHMRHFRPRSRIPTAQPEKAVATFDPQPVE